MIFSVKKEKKYKIDNVDYGENFIFDIDDKENNKENK
jgi:hypothetical protein